MKEKQNKKIKNNKKFDHSSKKYRKSIVEAMDEEKTKKYGFEKAYIIFENSINRLEKEGDSAEHLGVEYLRKRKLLSDNYRTNKIIALNTIKIEADIIDYDRKIIYETKSRKTAKSAKQAVIKKWKTFEYDRKGSNYENYQFIGILVANYENGQVVKGLTNCTDRTLDDTKIKEEFKRYFEKLNRFKK